MAKYIELKENLLGNDSQITSFSDEVYSKIKNVQQLLESLKDYSSRIGTPRDSKAFRRSLKEKLMNTTIELKEATDLLNRMENISVPESLMDQKRKQIRRLREACNKELTDATDLMKKIEKQEKIYVQNARSLQNQEEAGESFDRGDQSHSQSKQIMQMDIDEELLRERENDIVELTRLMTEMNAMAKLQAKYIQEQGEDLEIVAGNVTKTKENVKEAKTELTTAKGYKDKMLKSDTKMLVIVAIVCLIIIILFIFSGDSDSEADSAVPTTSTLPDPSSTSDQQ